MTACRSSVSSVVRDISLQLAAFVRFILPPLPSSLFNHVDFGCTMGVYVKSKMAAACVRTLGKVGRIVLETPACRTANSYALVPRNTLHGFKRAYGTGAGRVGSKPFFTSQLRSARVLGCAFLLGGGLGLYQTLKLTFQRHLAEEEAKVTLM